MEGKQQGAEDVAAGLGSRRQQVGVGRARAPRLGRLLRGLVVGRLAPGRVVLAAHLAGDQVERLVGAVERRDDRFVQVGMLDILECGALQVEQFRRPQRHIVGAVGPESRRGTGECGDKGKAPCHDKVHFFPPGQRRPARRGANLPQSDARRKDFLGLSAKEMPRHSRPCPGCGTASPPKPPLRPPPRRVPCRGAARPGRWCRRRRTRDAAAG